MKKAYIDSDEIKTGFDKCHKTINRLLVDSELLLKNGRYSSATSLAILAHEELGKAEYLRNKSRNNSEFDKKEWKEISFGGKSHHAKLKALLKTKLEIDKEFSEKKKIDKLPSFLTRMGFEANFDTDSEREYTKYLFEKIFPSLNLVKQDCFYLNWDEKTRKWIYFENRFDEKTKSAIVRVLLKETRHNALLQQLMFKLPDKPFNQYTTKDWQKYYGSKELEKITEIRHYLFSTKHDIDKKRAFSAIEKNYVKNSLRTKSTKKIE